MRASCFCFYSLSAELKSWQYKFEHTDEYKDTCGDLTCKRNNISQFYKLLVTKAKTATTCLCGICLESIKDEEIHVVSIQFFQMFCSASLSNWEGTIERESRL